MPLKRTKASEKATQEFGRRLQYLIYRQQLQQLDPVTQEDVAKGVAKQLGMKKPPTSASVSRWVLGQSIPDVLVLGALARHFKVDPGWITFGHESKAPAPYDEAAPPTAGTAPVVRRTVGARRVG